MIENLKESNKIGVNTNGLALDPVKAIAKPYECCC